MSLKIFKSGFGRFCFGVITMFSLAGSIVFFGCGTQYKAVNQSSDDFVYALPYAKGSSHRVVQGYNSWFSHKGRMAIDFKMDKGTTVRAARSGTVVRVEENFTKGGIGKKFYRKANMIVIKHSDETQAYYGHLQYKGALVQVGDVVQQGQEIGLSGSTGYSMFPHLHFIVWGPLPGGGRGQLPTRFSTNDGNIYLKPGTSYTATQ